MDDEESNEGERTDGVIERIMTGKGGKKREEEMMMVMVMMMMTMVTIQGGKEG